MPPLFLMQSDIRIVECQAVFIFTLDEEYSFFKNKETQVQNQTCATSIFLPNSEPSFDIPPLAGDEV
jgi:hypothetical protein